MDFEKLSIGIGAKLDNVTKIQTDLQAELNNIAKNLSIQVPKIEFSNIANSVKDIQKQLDTIKNTNIKVNTDIGKIDYLKSQNDLINNFGKQSGLSCSKEFNKAFKQGIIDSFNSGDIDKILSDSLKINSNLNDKINKTMSKEATKDLLRQYEGFINEIKGMKISLNNIEFDKSELQDKREMNEFDRHIEHSEIYEDNLVIRAKEKTISMEDEFIQKATFEELKRAIEMLPEIQKRRIKKYYFDDKDEYEIAKEEFISVKNVSVTLKSARENLKKILKKLI